MHKKVVNSVRSAPSFVATFFNKSGYYIHDPNLYFLLFLREELLVWDEDPW